MTQRCDWSDLPVDSCAHCRGITDLDSAEVIQVRQEEEAVIRHA